MKDSFFWVKVIRGRNKRWWNDGAISSDVQLGCTSFPGRGDCWGYPCEVDQCSEGVRMMGDIKINTDFAEVVERHMTGNCDRCGEKNILFDFEGWRYCEKCCEHTDRINA